MENEIIILEEDDSLKPKNFLKKKLDVPFYLIIKLIKNKKITLNGKKIKKDSILKKGDIIKIWDKNLSFVEKNSIKREEKNLNMQIIFENQDFIILNKKSDIVVQGSNDNSNSICFHLEYLKNKNLDKSDFNYFFAHRLDKDTSGALIIAKNITTLREFNKIFSSKKIIKKYFCLCANEFEKNSGEIRTYMYKNFDDEQKKMKTTNNENKKEAKLSISKYQVIKTFKKDEQKFSLVEVEIKTGITHQIRVHMKKIGHPILGDKMYGDKNINLKFSKYISRQFLHAHYLEFNFKEKNYKFDVELTDDLKKCLNYFEN